MVITRPAYARLLLCLCLVAAAAEGRAQTSREVNGGNVVFSSSSSRPNVTLLGGSVSVSALFDDGMVEAEECRPCSAGSTIRLGARIVAAGKGASMYQGLFTFQSAESVTVPDTEATELILTAPFTFNGHVRVGNSRNDTGASDHSFDLQGAGTVTLRLSGIVDPDTGQRLYFYKDVSYRFSPAR